MKAYRYFYKSSVDYGIRNEFIAEEEKNKLGTPNEIIDEKNKILEEDIEKLKKVIELLLKMMKRKEI